MTGSRLATRLAIREARRRPFRSLLVIALVAIPVMGMTVATTLIRTNDRTAMETWDATWGRADLVGHHGGRTYADTAPSTEDGPDAPAVDAPGATVADFVADLPPGSRTALMTTAPLAVRDDVRKAFVEVISADTAAHVFGDRYSLIDGRHPEETSEIAVNPAMAARFDVTTGGRLELVKPLVTFDVVGIVEDRECITCKQIYAGEVPVPAALAQYTETAVLVELPGEPSLQTLQAYQTNANGAIDGSVINYIEPRPIAGIGVYDPRPDAALRWSVVVGALTLAVVGIVIAAAFAVGARRQLVLLGQLSANGAPEALLRRMLVLQGTVTGLIGSVAGVAVGLGGVHVLRPTVERVLDRRLGGFELSLVELAAIMAIGIAGASLAARIPARSAARIPTLHALSGRRPVERVRGALTGSGLFAMIAGLVILAIATVGGRSGVDGNLWAAVATVGGLGVLFGATALTPAMVQRLEPFAGRTQGSLRIAARSLARNRTRTGAVIAAVAAAGALAVGGTAAARAVDTTAEYTSLAPNVALVSSQTFTPSGEGLRREMPDVVTEQLLAAVPDAEIHRPTLLLATDTTIEYPTSADGNGPGWSHTVLVVDDDLAVAIGLGDGARRALSADGIVVIDDDDGADTDVSVRFGDREPVEAALRFSRHSLDLIASGIYVSPAYANELDLSIIPGPLVLTAPRAFSEVELFDLTELYGDGGTGGPLLGGDTLTGDESLDLRIGYPDTSLDSRRIELLLAAISVLFALIVVTIGLALAAADERDERTVLAVAGAGPGVLAKVSGAKAWVLATLGFLLAVPMGFLPTATVVSASGVQSRALHFPTSVVLALVVLAPVAVAVVAFAFGSVTLRLRPVRVSTATFD